MWSSFVIQPVSVPPLSDGRIEMRSLILSTRQRARLHSFHLLSFLVSFSLLTLYRWKCEARSITWTWSLLHFLLLSLPISPLCMRRVLWHHPSPYFHWSFFFFSGVPTTSVFSLLPPCEFVTISFAYDFSLGPSYVRIHLFALFPANLSSHSVLAFFTSRSPPFPFDPPLSR